MDPLTELVDAIASERELLPGRVQAVTGHCPHLVPEIKSKANDGEGGQSARALAKALTKQELDGILALARFLARSRGKFKGELLPRLLQYLHLLVLASNFDKQTLLQSLAFTSPYFTQLLQYLHQLAEACPDVQGTISTNAAAIVRSVTARSRSSQDQHLRMPAGTKAFLQALGHVPGLIVPDDALDLAVIVYDCWVAPGSLPSDSSPADSAADENDSLSPKPLQNDKTGSARQSASEADPSDILLEESHQVGHNDKSQSELKAAENGEEGHEDSRVNGFASSPGDSISESHEIIEQQDREAARAIEAREVGFSILGQLCIQAKGNEKDLKGQHSAVWGKCSAASSMQLRSILTLLQKEGHRNSAELPSKREADTRFGAALAAAELRTSIVCQSAGRGREAVGLLLDVADACAASRWRAYPACEALFDVLLQGAVRIALAQPGALTREVLLRLKALMLATAAMRSHQASVLEWAGEEEDKLGPMAEAVAGAAVKLLRVEWDRERSACVSFLMALPAVVRDQGVENEPRARALGHGVITLLAHILIHLNEQAAVELVLPLYIESLEEGAASQTTHTRLRLVAAAACLASLGFSASYREVVVLLVRLYLDQLQASTAGDGTAVEREEGLPEAFLHIAKELKDPELRADYRARLLALCSDAGLLVEARSDATGPALLGNLLPAVAAACSDHHPFTKLDPSLHKLFRNLWFYIALLGLAPPLAGATDSGRMVPTGVPSNSPNLASLAAVRGPYKWRPAWSEAVRSLAEATPPLVLAGIKWLEDELELNALLNPGSRRGTANERAAACQRAALASTLAGRVDNSGLQSISGVKATYLLAVAWLEILRLGGSRGILKLAPGGQSRFGDVDGYRSSLWCTFSYLDTTSPSLEVHRCLEAVAKRVFKAAAERLRSLRATEEEVREKELVAHSALLLSLLTHRSPAVAELATSLLAQLRNTFPQVLWSSVNLDILLQLVLQAGESLPMEEVGLGSSAKEARIHVHDWLTAALLLAPATTQGLLQEKMRGFNLWSLTSGAGDFLTLLSDIHLPQSAPVTSIGGVPAPGNVPATKVAAGAAAGGAPHGESARSMDVLSKGMLSAMTKAQYVGEIAGMLRLYAGKCNDQEGAWEKPSGSHAMVQLTVNGGGVAQGAEGSYDTLVARCAAQLQALSANDASGSRQHTAAFRDACLRSAALLLAHKGGCSPLAPGQKALLRLLCWCPAQLFTAGAMEAGVFVWTWLLAAAPGLGPSLLVELADAWQWTRAAKRGIFATAPIAQGERALLRPQLTPGEPEGHPSQDPVQGIAAHRVWLGFLLDRFEVARHSSAQQLALFGRLLSTSLATAEGLTHHPAAAGTVFTLLLLGLRYIHHHRERGVASAGVELLQERVYRVGLAWFAVPPAWHDARDPDVSRSEAATLDAFLRYLEREDASASPQGMVFSSPGGSHPVWGRHKGVSLDNCRQLLLLLCQHEVDRLETWAAPLAADLTVRVKPGLISDQRWSELTRTAWAVHPRIAISMAARWRSVGQVRAEVAALVNSNIQELCDIPEALPFFVTPMAAATDSPVLRALTYYAPCSITQALEFLTPPFKGHARVMAYVLRVLQSYPPTQVTFFMPQLVQALRYDHNGLVEGYLLMAAQQNNIFAHRLIWQLQGEEAPPERELAAAKHPVQPSELWNIVPKIRQKVIAGFTPQARDVFEREFRLFDGITAISGKIKPLPKEERRAAIKPALEGIEVEGEDCYLPTQPSKLVRGIRRDSGVALQSAAKAPFMLAFDVVEANDPTATPTVQACIFKEGDDCRQDVLALQVIALLRDVFAAVNLDLYLFPYGVLPTGYECGIIEMVPNTRSRNQMGEVTDFGLYEMFQQEYGPVGSAGFERARNNFIVSAAGYAVASLILQPKDRHNGNLLFDSAGRLIHIDFGFILGISPGGNLGFESAQFKLSHEMTQLLDPSGAQRSEPWHRFKSLCVKGYLAARNHMEGIFATVELMADSGLPCFTLGRTLENLRKRFNPHTTEREAANFMLTTCDDAYNKWTTAGYDVIQYLQQDIQH